MIITLIGSVYATNDIQVIINDDYVNFETKPFIENGRTLVEIRKVFEQLGGEVNWEAETRTVILKKNDILLKLPIDKKDILIQGKTITLDAPAKIINNKTFIPLRFVSEQLGYDVKWNAETNTAFINDQIETLKEERHLYQPTYNLGNNVTYKGEVNEQKIPNGYGAIYYPNTNLIKYKGFWLNGEYNGKGKIYLQDGTLYTNGYFENGILIHEIQLVANGYGTYKYENGNIFKGILNNSLPTGYGILYNSNKNIISTNYLAKENDTINPVAFENNLIYKTIYDKNQKKIYSGFIDKSNLRQGEGKEFYENGIIKYNGTYKNNLYDGIGKLYSKNDKLLYDGEFKNGLKNGYGIEKYENGNIKYKGNFKNNLYNGEGTKYNEIGKNEIKGLWENNIFLHAIVSDKINNNEIYDEEGNLVYIGGINNKTKEKEKYGTEYYENGIIKYRGEYKNNYYYGKGQLFYKTGQLKYDGDFINNKYHGTGKKYDELGNLVYIGQFKQNDYYGKGKLYNENIIVYDGEFKNNLFNGEGIKYTGETIYYKGEFKNGNFDGQGNIYSSNKHLIYSGQFEGGLYHGYGKLYDNNTYTLIYKGQFLNNKYNGFGYSYNKDTGVIETVGNFIDGTLENGTRTILVKMNFSGKNIEYTYTGKTINNIPNGNGLLSIIDNDNIETKIYEGEFENGQLSGQGKLYANNILLYNGSFKNSKYNGQGILYLENETQEGRFENGVFIE